MKTRGDIGFRPTAARLALFAALWWLLNGGDARSWWIGVPVVVAASGLSLRLRSERCWSWRWAGVLPMGWFFLGQSVRSGFDVARLAQHPGLPLNPGVLRFRTRLPKGTPLLFFALLLDTAAIAFTTPDLTTAHSSSRRPGTNGWNGGCMISD